MKKVVLGLLVVVLTALSLPARAGSRPSSNLDLPIVSFQAPASYYPGGRTSAGVSKTAFTDAGAPVPFIPLVACRQYDSRSATPLANNTPRAIPLSGAPCGIPTQANAVAVNVTVFSITGATGNGVFKAGSVNPPTTAWINYPPTETQRANAGVLPVAGSATLYVQVNQGAGSVDFTVDVFGYYSNISAEGNFFQFFNNDATYVMFLQNHHTSCSGPCGLYSEVASGHAIWGFSTGTLTKVFGTVGEVGAGTPADSAGVYGLSEGTNTKTFGVYGQSNNSTLLDAAGVFGKDGSGVQWTAGGPLTGPAGVSGYGRTGVVGVTSDSVATTAQEGVFGGYLTSSTLLGNNGRLGTVNYGVYSMGNMGASGTKPFVEPHPTDASKVIRFVALEGNEAGTYFRGTVTVRQGAAAIAVPEEFRMVSDEEGLTVHLTPVGRAQAWIDSADLSRILIGASSDVTVHYIVHGVRKAYKDWQVLSNNVEYVPRSPDDRMPAAFADEIANRLIQNGTYHSDGTVNMSTAERVGWAEKWRQQAQQAISRAPQDPGEIPRR